MEKIPFLIKKQCFSPYRATNSMFGHEHTQTLFGLGRFGIFKDSGTPTANSNMILDETDKLFQYAYGSEYEELYGAGWKNIKTSKKTKWF